MHDRRTCAHFQAPSYCKSSTGSGETRLHAHSFFAQFASGAERILSVAFVRPAVRIRPSNEQGTRSDGEGAFEEHKRWHEMNEEQRVCTRNCTEQTC